MYPNALKRPNYIYNAKWYHFVYAWFYNLFHKEKLTVLKESFLQASLILPTMEYSYSKKDMEKVLRFLMKKVKTIKEKSEKKV